MTSVRIKDLTTGTPAVTDYLPIDRAAGTRKADIQTVVNAAIGRYSGTVTTTNATPTLALTITPANNYAYILTMYATCIQSDGSASYSRRANLSVRKFNGTVNGDGSGFATASGGSAGLSTTDAAPAASSGDIIVNVTGVAATTIKWIVVVDLIGVSM